MPREIWFLFAAATVGMMFAGGIAIWVLACLLAIFILNGCVKYRLDAGRPFVRPEEKSALGGAYIMWIVTALVLSERLTKPIGSVPLDLAVGCLVLLSFIGFLATFVVTDD